jgi:serine/threonine protein kinase
LQAFSFQELVRATGGFSEELGRGAFGIVYKGVIDINGTKRYVAVKKLDKVAEEGEKEFRAELSVIAHTHHKNLVRLLGFCDDADKRLLVYEYMSNGTLASFLFGLTKPSWKQRIEIALAVAKGILYLHEECATQIIHCDIKPQNVLLDDHYNARISDFGLSKLLMVDQSYTQTGLRGTKGYVAPEWFRNTKITTKVDVYSFGVLLLEIITCRKSVGGEEVEPLVDWVWDCFYAEKLENLVENDVEALDDIKNLERFVLVGIWCIQEDPLLRPNIKKVYQMLEGVVQVTPPPCPFPFSVITN